MSDKKSRLYDLLKEQKGVSIAQLAEELLTSQEFILGMVESNEWCRVKDNIVTLSGLGMNKCIVCAENGMEDYNSMKVSLPPEILSGRKLERELSLEIRGHRRCYSTIDLFFRYEGGLLCWNCSSWSGAWIDGDEVEEKCSTLGDVYAGHQGVIGKDNMCNFFSPCYEMREEDDQQGERDKWETIKSGIVQRTQRGYKNLVSLLEKARLIE